MEIGERSTTRKTYYLPMLLTKGGLRAFCPPKIPTPTRAEAERYATEQAERAHPIRQAWEIHKITTTTVRECVGKVESGT